MPKGPPHISLERAGLPAHGLMAQALCNSSSFHAHSCIIFAICCAPNGGACGQVASAFLLTKLGLGVSLHIPRAGFGGVRIDRRQDCMALAAQRLLALASMFIGCGPGQPHMPSHGIHVTGKLSHCPLLYPVAATWPTQCPQIQSTIAQTVRCPCKPFAWTQGLQDLPGSIPTAPGSVQWQDVLIQPGFPTCMAAPLLASLAPCQLHSFGLGVLGHADALVTLPWSCITLVSGIDGTSSIFVSSGPGRHIASFTLG